MNFVNLRERRVVGRYDAVGQMNFVPGVWDPTWAPAQVRGIKGDGSHRNSLTPRFSIFLMIQSK